MKSRISQEGVYGERKTFQSVNMRQHKEFRQVITRFYVGSANEAGHSMKDFESSGVSHWSQ